MSTPTLTQYLAQSRTKTDHKAIDLVVMGNEACDLDSMVSSIVLAYTMAAKQQNGCCIPLLPIKRGDFRLRPEAVDLFKLAKIDLQPLVFLDDIEPDGFMARTKNIILVDHNQLSRAFESHGPKISMILDHHKDQGLYPQAKKTIQAVGSCATLVGERLIKKHPELVAPCPGLLLLGAILLDTVNLDPKAGRVTPKDKAMAAALAKFSPSGLTPFFNHLQSTRFSTKDLSSFDLLKRDYKAYGFKDFRWGIGSALVCLEAWEKRENNLGLAFESYARSKNLDLLGCMIAYKAQGFHRQMVLYAKNGAVHDGVVRFLEKKLDFEPYTLKHKIGGLNGKISFYAQKNLEISRKKLAPILETYFKLIIRPKSGE
ncbi:MAG: DHH family phosphoesterase [Desulfobacter sp.]|nr:DHH family phosphoesterase [Desulfobacter sp.]WDP87565.1 MAG: DHH family phosphoesterase [Desulfobacter sp.]